MTMPGTELSEHNANNPKQNQKKKKKQLCEMPEQWHPCTANQPHDLAGNLTHHIAYHTV